MGEGGARKIGAEELLALLGFAPKPGSGRVDVGPEARWEAHEMEQALALRGDLAVPDDDAEAVLATVKLESGLFSGSALPLYQMPGMSVLETMLMPYEPMKMYKMVELLKTALSDEKSVGMLELLSMRDLAAVLNQWVDRSNEKEESLESRKNA